MGKRKRINTKEKSGFNSLTDLSLDELNRLQKSIPYAFQSKIQASLNSNDPEEIMKANLYLGEITPNSGRIQSVFFDPNDLSGNGKGFKDSKGVLSFDVLRRMGNIHIIRSIVNTRIEQIQNFLHFSEDDQKEGFTIRKKTSLFKESKKEISSVEKKKIEEIVEFLMNSGFNEKWDNIDDFQTFVRKIAFDSLTLDQLAFEVVRDKGWNIKKYRAVDASLIRFLDSVDPKQRERLEDYRFKGYLPRFCMTWDDQILINPTTKEPILYYPWELGFGIRNKSSDIRKNGYGTSELEILVDLITGVLWSIQYNMNNFSIGSTPKGFINVKNANISDSNLNEFRQAWSQMMVGVRNCLKGDTNIITKEYGLISLEDLFDKSEKFEVWTGKKFELAHIFKTQKKRITYLKLNNGTSIECSPEHRFKVVSDRGVIEWKERKDIKLGDYVLCNKKAVDGDFEVYYEDKKFEEDIYELLGWLTGDGMISKGNAKNKRFSLFFNVKKERYIAEKFHNVLCKYGINNQIKEKKRNKKQIEDTKKRYGFNTVDCTVLWIQCIDSKFYEFIRDLGFTASCNRKCIPSFLHKIPSKNRCAFIRGFFSADGCTPKNTNNATITIVDNEIRNEMRLLLLTEGIECVNCEGSNVMSTFLQKTPHIGGYQLTIKSKEEFFKKISYIQPYKRRDFYKTTKLPYSIHVEMGKRLVNLMRVELYRRSLFKEELNISKRSREYLTEVGSGQTVTINKILEIAQEMNFELPYETDQFYYSKVIELRDTEEEVEMYDISIDDEEHQFIANGMLTHNSKRTPVINGIDLEWIDLDKSNREMEYQEWAQFLVIMVCSVYRIDPSELGFSFKNQAQLFGQDGQKARLQHSREKGLKPILIFLENIITKYIVSEIDEDYEFVFTGIEVEDEETQVNLDKIKLESGMVSMQDIFKKYSGREFDSENDIILNQVYQQAQASKQQQEMFGSSVPGEMSEEGVPQDEEINPFDKYKSIDNPIMTAAFDYIGKNFGK